MIMTQQTTQPDLSIIIVNYNGGDELIACLQSLLDAAESILFEVIVVDNDSSDSSMERAEKIFTSFKFIRAGENLGFAKANNLGLKHLTGRHAMLLNPDTEVLPGALSRLLRALDQQVDWGIVGPTMVGSSGRPYRAARRFPTPFGLFCETTKLNRMFPYSAKFNGYVYGDRPLVSLDEVDQIEGSALMIRGEAREKVGNLDENFFIFFEEVDWCRRVRDAGYEIHIVRDAVIRHHRSTTMSRYFERTRRFHANSAMKYFCKHHGKAGLKSLRRWMWCGLFIREMMLRVAMVFGGGGRVRLRAQAARAERAIYRKGFPS
jgi:GT2 family glycosyltransferase